jgi:hypothetical protein
LLELTATSSAHGFGLVVSVRHTRSQAGSAIWANPVQTVRGNSAAVPRRNLPHTPGGVLGASRIATDYRRNPVFLGSRGVSSGGGGVWSVSSDSPSGAVWSGSSVVLSQIPGGLLLGLQQQALLEFEQVSR